MMIWGGHYGNLEDDRRRIPASIVGYPQPEKWRRGWDLKIPENTVSTTYSAMDGM